MPMVFLHQQVGGEKSNTVAMPMVFLHQQIGGEVENLFTIVYILKCQAGS